MVALGFLLVPVDRMLRGLVLLLTVNGVRLALGLVLVWGVLAGASAATDLESFLARTGLDEDLVSVFTVQAPGGALGFVCVHVTDRTLNAQMGPRLAELLPAYVDRNAVVVMATGRGSSFDPGSLAFVQGDAEVRPSAENTTSVTGDFLSGKLSSSMATTGLVVLGDKIDPSQPYVIRYGDLGYAEMAVRVEVAADRDPPSADAADEGTAVDGATAPSAEGKTEQRCDPCRPLLGCFGECFEPCDPCSGVQSILPLFLLLLLGL